MVYGIYQSAAGLQVNQYRQDVLANNLANVDTAGFKHDLTVVRERRVESDEDLVDTSWTDPMLNHLTGGSLVAPTVTAFEQGMIKTDGGPLDVAITGDGFFTVQDGDAVRYTRDGRFTLDAEGHLVTVAGSRPVLDQQGQPIVVPPDAAGKAQIDGSGQVRAGDATYGRLGIVAFEDKSALCKAGGNLFEAVGAEPVAHTVALQTKAFEASTVDPTRALVAMIEVTRAYQLNATMLTLADSTLSRAVNDIARLR